METSSDDLQKRPRIANPDTLAQSADYGIRTGATQLLSSGVVGPYQLLEGRGQPDVDAEDASRARQLDRRHAHDREWRSIDRDRAAQHRRIAAELREPYRVADYRDRAGLDSLETAPMGGPRSHRIEVVGLHHLGRHDPGLASDTHANRSRYKRRRGDVFEHVAGRLPNIEKVRIGIR